LLKLLFDSDKSMHLLIVASLLLIPLISRSQDDEFFRIYPQHTYEELLQMARSSRAPESEHGYRNPKLVNLEDYIPNIQLEIRYATTKNFMGMKFYEAQESYLQKPAAKALARVAKMLKRQGLGLIIYDAYRPWYVTKMFWDATPDSLKNYVANPVSGSKHNRGCAVDLGLYYLNTGKKVPMPTDYDDFSEKAHISFTDTSSTILANRQILQKAMKKGGFRVYQYEWWHFDYKDWEKYPVINLTFQELSK